MYSNEEAKMEELKKKFDEVDIPENAINQAIFAGFQQAKNESAESKIREVSRKAPMKKWMLGAAAVAIFFLSLFTSIRFSPTFANYIAVIPGMEKIVELIRHDKGMLTAVENEYFQEMGMSVEKNGVEVILDGAIADEYGLILFYTINTEEKQTNVRLEDVSLSAMDGGEVDVASVSFGGFHYSDEGEKTFSGTIEYFFQNPLTAKQYRLDFLAKGDTVEEKGSIEFNLTKDFPPMKTYPIDKTVMIEDQKIRIVEAELTPLRVAIQMELDPNNTKKLLEFQDLRLVDQNGEAWGKITNGTTASRLSDTEVIYYLQSNYFKEAEELYLVFNKIQAIDKEKDAVVIDTEKQKILSQPDGNKLRDLKVSGGNVSFKLYVEEEFPYGMFADVRDAEGNQVEIASSYWSERPDEGYKLYGVEIPNLKSYPNPIALHFSFFPEWIVGEGKVRIK